jgi:DNA-binding NarL/FixJ family response regulator
MVAHAPDDRDGGREVNPVGSSSARSPDPGLEALRHELAHVSGDGRPVTPRLLAPLARHLDSTHALSYAFRLGAGGIDLDYYVTHGPDVETWPGDFGAAFRREPRGYLAYDPQRPEARQRNRAVVVTAEHMAGVVDRSPASYRELARRYRLVLQADQLRLLVCEGPVLLAWVGVVRVGGYDEEVKARLQRLAAPLRRRLVCDLRMGIDRAPAALDVAMERLGTPAFIVRDDGAVAHSNRAGRALWDADPAALRAGLRAPRGDGSWSVTRIAAAGQPQHRLVIRTAAPPRAPERVAELRSRFRLSARDAAGVLAVAAGKSNKEIAAELRCSESTVEGHLTRVYQRTGRAGRGALGAFVYEAS